MNFLITGGCGFIGTCLIKNILADNVTHNILVVDNLCVGSKEDLRAVCAFEERRSVSDCSLSGQVQLFCGDVLDDQLALHLGQGIDVIVHLAANTGVGPSVIDPRTDCMVNVVGTLNYLEAARLNKIPRFIFASSGAPVGEVNPPIHEELPPHPVSPYGASKLAGEGYCSAYYQTFGVETVALRFGNVYGPGSLHKSSVVAKFIKQAIDGEELEIYGDGTQTRDFIYIQDLLVAIQLAATRKGIGGEIFQIATNAETTITEVTSLLLKELDKRGIKFVKVKHGQRRMGDVMRNYSDTSKARRLLGWTPKFDLKNGLSHTLDYFLLKETL